MWIRLDDKSEKQFMRESIDRLESEVQFMEAINELQNSIYKSNLYDEDTGKAMSWLKEKLQKVCPSPDKLKEFFSGLGQKMDSKVQSCKNDSIKNAWNGLKGMMAATDIPDEDGNEEDGEIEDNPENGEEQEEITGGEEQDEIPSDDEDEVAAESLWEEEEYEDELYEEGLWDSIKSGWNKLTGKEEQPAPRRRRRATGRKTAKKGVPAKRASSGKTTSKRGATRKTTARKTTAKRGTARKGGAKRGKKQQNWKSKIWEFIKGHWKQIVIVLLACLALYFLGSWIAAMFLKSPVATTAAKTVTKDVQKFKLPIGMKKLPPGAKLVGNGVVKFANGGWLAAQVADIDVDF